ncbi:MAG TPA: chemotaxis protein [Pseudomonas sp.]|nr:chemotaxis protein [Pseudomonas sp.]
MTLWKRSIQWQLIISMGAALGVTTLIVVLIYSSVLHQMTERYLIKQALPAQVSAIRNDLERTLAGPISATEAIAGNSLVQDWLAYGENPIRMSAFARYLDGVKQQQNALTTSIAVLESGNFYSEQGQIRVMSRDNPADSWFYTLVDGDQDQVASIDTDKTSGLPTLFINQRIALKDKTLGVAGLGYSLQSLSELIGGFQFGERGVIFLIGADQQVKVHPNASFNDSRSLSDLTSVEAANTLTAGSEPVRFQRDNEAWLASAQPLQRLGLTLVSLVPEDEIYADARAALLRTSLIAGAVGLLALALMALLVRGLVQPLRRVSQALGAISAGGGDLNARLDDKRDDELGELARGFNAFVASQRQLISDVLITSRQLSSAVTQVAQVVDNTAERAVRQHEMTDLVATAAHEMGLTVQEIARNANSAANSSSAAQAEAVEGRAVVGRSVEAIERMSADIGRAADSVTELADQITSIDRVLTVIRSVSEQTNLLALNAAIEAARAGEQGRGFAVVADEVRTLARRTQQSTEEIEQMIARLQEGVAAAVKAMGSSHGMTAATVESSLQVQQGLDSILKAVTQIVDQSQQIAAAAEQQTVVSHDIDQNIVQINQAGERTAQGAQRAEEASGRLGHLVQSLQSIISAFKV